MAAPTHRSALENMKSDDCRFYALGPYTDEEECRELVSYLKIKWKLEIRAHADEDTVVWVKNTVNDYNIASGE